MKVLISWSSGKDSAWMLHTLMQRGDIEIAGLVTTLNADAGRVAMHAVRRQLLRQQADASGLPLLEVELPWPCDNATYENIMAAALQAAHTDLDISHVAFGDLFLEDVRDYRIRQLSALDVEPLFPLWGLNTGKLARDMLASGLRAKITCVDPRQLDPEFAGRDFDAALLDALPHSVDPCGENGEFHTFVHGGPMFTWPVEVNPGEVVERDGFVYADLLPGVT